MKSYTRRRWKRITLFLFLCLVFIGGGIYLRMDSNESLREVNKVYHPEPEELTPMEKIEKNEETIKTKINKLEKKAKEVISILEDDGKDKEDINTKVEEKEDSSKTKKKDSSSWLDWWWVYLIGGWLISKLFGGD